jgi:hypothetical protein
MKCIYRKPAAFFLVGKVLFTSDSSCDYSLAKKNGPHFQSVFSKNFVVRKNDNIDRA